MTDHTFPPRAASCYSRIVCNSAWCFGLLRGVLLVLLLSGTTLAADSFDRHSSYWLSLAAKNGEPLEAVTSGKAAQWKYLGRDISQSCIVVKTANGNWAKALVSWGFRKADPMPVPVLLLERYVTYDRDRPNITVAHGSNLMLFPGFEFDFDIGQVVPSGLGGDVAFNEKRQLVPLEGAQLFGLDGPAVPPGEDEEYDPQAQPGVQPRDFAGEWRVTADGRWYGTWNLSVDDEGNIDGQYLSSDTKSTFPVKGRLALGEPNRAQLEVEFAVASQQYDLYMFTGDKSAMCGTTTIVDRKFGVIAHRVPKDKPAAEPAAAPK
jgi:hypothetical protein